MKHLLYDLSLSVAYSNLCRSAFLLYTRIIGDVSLSAWPGAMLEKRNWHALDIHRPSFP